MWESGEASDTACDRRKSCGGIPESLTPRKRRSKGKRPPLVAYLLHFCKQSIGTLDLPLAQFSKRHLLEVDLRMSRKERIQELGF